MLEIGPNLKDLVETIVGFGFFAFFLWIVYKGL